MVLKHNSSSKSLKILVCTLINNFSHPWSPTMICIMIPCFSRSKSDALYMFLVRYPTYVLFCGCHVPCSCFFPHLDLPLWYALWFHVSCKVSCSKSITLLASCLTFYFTLFYFIFYDDKFRFIIFTNYLSFLGLLGE